VATTTRYAHTLKETAELVGPVSIRTIYNWIDREGLKVTKVAGRPMILDDDLKAFVAKYRGEVAN
jgi:hypothetical protein